MPDFINQVRINALGGAYMPENLWSTVNGTVCQFNFEPYTILVDLDTNILTLIPQDGSEPLIIQAAELASSGDFFGGVFTLKVKRRGQLRLRLPIYSDKPGHEAQEV
jgi:hypothetical protein